MLQLLAFKQGFSSTHHRQALALIEEALLILMQQDAKTPSEFQALTNYLSQGTCKKGKSRPTEDDMLCSEEQVRTFIECVCYIGLR